VQAGLRRIGELVGPLMAGERGFERKLQRPIGHALAYCDELVETLPHLIDIDRAAFASDPLVHALFATANDIETMLGQSEYLRQFLTMPDTYGIEHFYALLASRRHEKSIMGIARTGDVVRNDVPQRMLYFSDHTLTVFAVSPELARMQLRSAAFDSLLKTFAAHVLGVRGEQNSLYQERELERARILASRGRLPPPELALRTRQLATLDARLRQNAESLLPARMIDALAAFLMTPDEALRLEPLALQIDRSGVLAGEGTLPPGEVSAIEFAELVSRDRRKHVVVPVRIRRQDAILALEQVRDERSRLILI
jgi:hypothetical protein